jgi:hypothetical protein
MELPVRRLKLGLMWLALAVVIGYGAYLAYLARLTYTGYCHAAEKYLTDDEKIRVALVDLLKKYPPAVIRTAVEPNVFSMSTPNTPIFYRNVNDFLFQNPNCCNVLFHTFPVPDTRPEAMPTLIAVLTGTATRVVEVTYQTRFKDAQGAEQTIMTKGYLHINNCGKSAKPWFID